MSAFARPLFCNFKTVSNTVYYCLTSLACLQWQWVLSVAIAQICCSCSAVFCCVDAKKSADLISQCCASFDPITKYFLFKFGGLIKQSPHSYSQIKEMYKDFSNRQSALQETLFFFSYIDDTVLVMFLSQRCAHHAPHSRVVLMLWIIKVLTFVKVIIYNVYRVHN